MNTNQAHQLINEIESSLYDGTPWHYFWRATFNEMEASKIDRLFHEALAKLHVLGALDADFNQFINIFIRAQIQRFYNQLYQNRKWHLLHGYVYAYDDVLEFVRQSQELVDLLRKKVNQMRSDAA